MEEREIYWRWYPIVDGSPPASVEKFLALARDLERALERGKRVVVHCQAGLGRSGTVVAGVLIRRGLSIKEAIKRVREVRPGAIQTMSQVEFLLELV